MRVIGTDLSFRTKLLLVVREVTVGWFGVSTQNNESWILRDNELILCEELVHVPRPGSNIAVRVIVWDRRGKHLGICVHTWKNFINFCLYNIVCSGVDWIQLA